MKTVNWAMNDLILHFEPHFYKILERLTPRQLNFLKALVEQGSGFCSESILKAYQLGSSSNVARIKLSLEKKEIINTESHGNVIVDPLFREWLQIHYFKSN